VYLLLQDADGALAKPLVSPHLPYSLERIGEENILYSSRLAVPKRSSSATSARHCMSRDSIRTNRVDVRGMLHGLLIIRKPSTV
jgi:hypothetical protein